MAGTWVSVGRVQEIAVGQVKPVTVDGARLLLCRTAEGVYAVDDTCTHDDGPLADGWLDGDAIECPRHGARFDVRTGQVLCLPAAVAIRSYPVTVEGENIMVRVTE